MDPGAMLAKQAALAAQCPAAKTVPEAEAVKLPIHVDRIGAVGPRILIIHGGVQGAIGGGPKTCVHQKVLGERGWRVEIVDRPGFGDSPSRGVDDVDAAAIWIADMLGDGAHLVGHSWGGAASLLAAGRRPEAVRSLTFVEPALQVLAVTDPLAQGDEALRELIFGLLGVPLAAAQTPADYARGFIAQMGEGLHVADPAGWRDEAMFGFGCSMLQGRMPSPFGLRIAADVVAKANIPVLAIAGDWSPPIQAATTLGARATNGRYVEMASPNHFPQFENPEVFNRILESFLREVEGAPAATADT
jgi:pimeloyl-ACP methyl ester carboxylesterase